MSWILHGAYGGSCCFLFFHVFALKNGKQVARVLNSVSVSKKSLMVMDGYSWWKKFGQPLEVLVVYHIIYRVLYIPGGAEFLPSTVWTSNWKGHSKETQVERLLQSDIDCSQYIQPHTNQPFVPMKFWSVPHTPWHTHMLLQTKHCSTKLFTKIFRSLFTWNMSKVGR